MNKDTLGSIQAAIGEARRENQHISYILLGPDTYTELATDSLATFFATEVDTILGFPFKISKDVPEEGFEVVSD